MVNYMTRKEQEIIVAAKNEVVVLQPVNGAIATLPKTKLCVRQSGDLAVANKNLSLDTPKPSTLMVSK